jgi:fructose-1,6-bisphosphatase-3
MGMPCSQCQPTLSGEQQYTEHEVHLIAQLHKAITMIQLKLEGQIIKGRPHYQMGDRLLLDKIDYQRGIVRVNMRRHTDA